ncbi:early boundary activity protein 2-like isoform X3 [Bicyclus anynana]|uniref:Early boundary activity protein 2-like isoform X3 n=1 Tax=Bicyclus anynana TaxID=110368 RepID=A0ABM3LVY2_BICAN|nr:early boundary activity protein 2-like isoform X3 [Bicyclus anynana]
MSARSKIEKWLLADWSTGNNNLPVVGEDVKIMTLQPNEGAVEEEMVYERPLLEQQLRLTKANESKNSKDDNIPCEGRDYSPSGSSWAPSDEESSSDESDVPIGSGKTLIHKDKFRKVNWKSYTIATRTLLLATFPRRILATHSLTGKRSPAFQDKPAKMCLDPKIVSDIIIEITSKFNVKENLVRSAITTKCADECKMFKMRTLNKNKLTKLKENAPPLRRDKLELRQVKNEIKGAQEK